MATTYTHRNRANGTPAHTWMEARKRKITRKSCTMSRRLRAQKMYDRSKGDKDRTNTGAASVGGGLFGDLSVGESF